MRKASLRRIQRLPTTRGFLIFGERIVLESFLLWDINPSMLPIRDCTFAWLLSYTSWGYYKPPVSQQQCNTTLSNTFFTPLLCLCSLCLASFVFPAEYPFTWPSVTLINNSVHKSSTVLGHSWFKTNCVRQKIILVRDCVTHSARRYHKRIQRICAKSVYCCMHLTKAWSAWCEKRMMHFQEKSCIWWVALIVALSGYSYAHLLRLHFSCIRRDLMFWNKVQ